MTSRILWPMLLLLSGCAALHTARAPDCRGPARPANPYGSVLQPGAPAVPLPPRIGGCGRGRP